MPVARDVVHRFHRTRLLVYGVLAVSYMLVFIHRVAPAALASDLMHDFHTTGAELGSLAAMYFYVYAAMQIPAGVLADTLGVRIAATAGAIVAGAGSIVFGLAPNLGVASVGRFFIGLGVSVVFVGFMRANTEWWSERRYGFISGLTVFVGNVGAILATAPLAALLLVTSWRSTFVAIGAVSLAIGALTYGFVRDRPEDAGFPSLREMEGKGAHAPRAGHWIRSLVAVLKRRELWPVFFCNLGFCGSSLALITLWGVPMITDIHHVSRAEASIYTSVGIASLALGSLALGTLSDRIGRRKPVLVGACFASALIWLLLLLAPWAPGWSGFLLFALLGFATAGFVVSFGTAKELVEPAIAGTGIALVNTGIFLGAAIVQPLFGALMDLTWDGTLREGVRIYQASDYANGLLLCVGMTCMSAIASLYVRETYARNVTLVDPGHIPV